VLLYFNVYCYVLRSESGRQTILNGTVHIDLTSTMQLTATHHLIGIL